MERKKKVLHLLTSDVYSGAENVVCQIIEGFKANSSYEMVYCSLDGQIGDILQEKKIKFMPINKFSYLNVKEVIEEYQPDIIHAHDTKASVMASLFWRKCRVISHLHGNHDNMKKINAKTLLYYATYKKYHKIISVSKSIKADFAIKKVLEDTTLLYSVLNKENIMSKYLSDKNEYDFDVVFLGRLNNIKDPIRVIEIFNQVCRLKNDAKMAIIGDGELREQVEKRVIELGLSNNIKVLGYMTNPHKVLGSSKALILTSRYEGMPMCVLEAMALGVPIVSTPTDGVKEIIEDGIDGYLSNDNKVLVRALFALISDKEKWDEISANTLKKFNEINDLDVYMETLNEMYK